MDRVMRIFGVFVVGFLLAGCGSSGPTNPGWSMSLDEKRGEFERMESSPVELERPVLVIGGYMSPPWVPSSYAVRLSRLTGVPFEDFAGSDLLLQGSLRDAVGVVLADLNDRYPHPSEVETIEVDVVGISMGGIVAMLAAQPEEGRPRLNIRRLFTLGSPHRGASLAMDFPIDQAAQDMRYKSIMLVKLQEERSKGGYELYPYGITNDAVVGVRNTSPWGEDPIWVRGRRFGAHFDLEHDDAILIDVARRLRGEDPVLVAAPLPGVTDRLEGGDPAGGSR